MSSGFESATNDILGEREKRTAPPPTNGSTYLVNFGTSGWIRGSNLRFPPAHRMIGLTLLLEERPDDVLVTEHVERLPFDVELHGADRVHQDAAAGGEGRVDHP